MFFVFSYGRPNEGEASGGLGDMIFKSADLDEAKMFGQDSKPRAYYDDVEILDGNTGNILDYYPPIGWAERN